MASTGDRCSSIVYLSYFLWQSKCNSNFPNTSRLTVIMYIIIYCRELSAFALAFADQLADIFTKTHPLETFSWLVFKLKLASTLPPWVWVSLREMLEFIMDTFFFSLISRSYSSEISCHSYTISYVDISLYSLILFCNIYYLLSDLVLIVFPILGLILL